MYNIQVELKARVDKETCHQLVFGRIKNYYYTFKEHKESCLYLRKFAPSKKFRNNKLSPILAEKGNELKGFFSAFNK